HVSGGNSVPNRSCGNDIGANPVICNGSRARYWINGAGTEEGGSVAVRYGARIGYRGNDFGKSHRFGDCNDATSWNDWYVFAESCCSTIWFVGTSVEHRHRGQARGTCVNRCDGPGRNRECDNCALYGEYHWCADSKWYRLNDIGPHYGFGSRCDDAERHVCNVIANGVGVDDREAHSIGNRDNDIDAYRSGSEYRGTTHRDNGVRIALRSCRFAGSPSRRGLRRR